ncbi:MAG: hypothetical protein ACLPKT_08150 [Methylocella sp.]
MSTDWLSDGTAREQGVRHVWPCAVRTLAPGGSDSNCKVCNGGGDGFDVNQSGMENGEPEHPASATPITAAKTGRTRDIEPLSIPEG